MPVNASQGAAPQGFESIKARLDEIVEAVSDENLPLDDALDLYEEAIALGMRVSDTIEENIVIDDASLEEDQVVE